MFSLCNELSNGTISIKNIVYKRKEEINTTYTQQHNSIFEILYNAKDGESEINGKQVHRYVLCNRCSFFNEYFQTKNSGIIQQIQCDDDILEGLIVWCYLDKFSLSIDQTMKLFDFLQRHQINEPVECLFIHLISLIRNEFLQNKHDQFDSLQTFFLVSQHRKYYEREFHVISMIIYEEIQKKQDFSFVSKLLPFILLSIQNDLHITRDKKKDLLLSQSLDLNDSNQLNESIALLQNEEKKHLSKDKKSNKKKTNQKMFQRQDDYQHQLEDVAKLMKEKELTEDKKVKSQNNAKTQIKKEQKENKPIREIKESKEEKKEKYKKKETNTHENKKESKKDTQTNEMSVMDEMFNTINEGFENLSRSSIGSSKSKSKLKEKQKKHNNHNENKEKMEEENDNLNINFTDDGNGGNDNNGNESDDFKIVFDDYDENEDSKKMEIVEIDHFEEENENTNTIKEKSSKNTKNNKSKSTKTKQTKDTHETKELKTTDEINPIVEEKVFKQKKDKSTQSRNTKSKKEKKPKQPQIIKEEEEPPEEDYQIFRRETRRNRQRIESEFTDHNEENGMMQLLDEPETSSPLQEQLISKSMNEIPTENNLNTITTNENINVNNENTNETKIPETQNETEKKESQKEGSVLSSVIVNKITGEQVVVKDYPMTKKNKSELSKLLSYLSKNRHGYLFKDPVDPEKLGIPDYFNIVKKPMDISTIRKKMRENEYTTVNQVLSDIELMWDNAFLFNRGNAVIIQCTQEIADYYNRKLRDITFSYD